MILLLDTSTPVCKLTFIDDEYRFNDEWQADRELAKGLLKYLHTNLKSEGKTWKDISGIGVFQGPGSFTGLRIGITVLNTIADSLAIPIVSGKGDDWQQEVRRKLEYGDNEHIVLPFYNSEPHITKPRK